MLTVNLDGNFFTKISSPQLLQMLADDAGVDVSRISIPAEELASYTALQTRMKVRRDILPTAGDTQSIQGTIADNVGHLMEELGRFMAAVYAADNLDDIKIAAQPLATNLAPLIAAIDSDQCTLTHHVKGTSQVVTDACNRADAVAAALVANAGE